MRIYQEIAIEDFEPWSSAVSTWEDIINAGKAEIFEQAIEELYPEGLSEMELNDLLWHESDWCYSLCDMTIE